VAFLNLSRLKPDQKYKIGHDPSFLITILPYSPFTIIVSSHYSRKILVK